MYKDVRRSERAVSGNDIESILLKGEYGFLALGTQDNGYAYGIPMNYAYLPDESLIYYHGALEGVKIEQIEKNNKVSFCVVSSTEPIPEKFSTRYESAIVFGIISIVEDNEEKKRALRALVDKYSLGHEEAGEKYINSYVDRTGIFKLEISYKSGKAKR